MYVFNYDMYEIIDVVNNKYGFVLCKNEIVLRYKTYDIFTVIKNFSY